MIEVIKNQIYVDLTKLGYEDGDVLKRLPELLGATLAQNPVREVVFHISGPWFGDIREWVEVFLEKNISVTVICEDSQSYGIGKELLCLWSDMYPRHFRFCYVIKDINEMVDGVIENGTDLPLNTFFSVPITAHTDGLLVKYLLSHFDVPLEISVGDGSKVPDVTDIFNFTFVIEEINQKYKGENFNLSMCMVESSIHIDVMKAEITMNNCSFAKPRFTPKAPNEINVERIIKETFQGK